MRKAKIFLSSICILSLLFSSSHSLFANSDKQENTQTINAYVDKIKGTIFISKKLYRDRSSNSAVKLKVGDIIWTLKNSSSNIIFEDGSIFRLSENTKFEVQKLDKDEADLNVQNGSVWARVLKPIGSGTTYNVQTKSVSASVRGTSVLFRHGEDSGLVGIKVIDSVKDKGAIILKPAKSKSSKGFKIDKETSVFLDFKNKFGKADKINVEEEFKKDEEVKENTTKDLIYLNNLIKEKTKSSSSSSSSSNKDETDPNSNSSSTKVDSSGKEIIEPKINIDLEKVTGEIFESLPTKKEAKALFDNEEIVSAYSETQEEIESFQEDIDNQNIDKAVESLNKMNNLIVKDEIITEIKESNKTKTQDSEDNNNNNEDSEDSENNTEDKLDKIQEEKIEAAVKIVMENDLSEEEIEEVTSKDSVDVEKVFETYEDKASIAGDVDTALQFAETKEKTKKKQEKEEKEKQEKTDEEIQEKLEKEIKKEVEDNKKYLDLQVKNEDDNSDDSDDDDDDDDEEEDDDDEDNNIGDLDIKNDGESENKPKIDGKEVNGTKQETKKYDEKLNSNSTQNTYVYKGEEFLVDNYKRKYWYLPRWEREEKIEEEFEKFKKMVDDRMTKEDKEKAKELEKQFNKEDKKRKKELEEKNKQKYKNNDDDDENEDEEIENNNNEPALTYEEKRQRQIEEYNKKQEEYRKSQEEKRKKYEEQRQKQIDDYNKKQEEYRKAQEDKRKKQEEEYKKQQEEYQKSQEEARQKEEENRQKNEEKRSEYEEEKRELDSKKSEIEQEYREKIEELREEQREKASKYEEEKRKLDERRREIRNKRRFYFKKRREYKKVDEKKREVDYKIQRVNQEYSQKINKEQREMQNKLNEVENEKRKIDQKIAELYR